MKGLQVLQKRKAWRVSWSVGPRLGDVVKIYPLDDANMRYMKRFFSKFTYHMDATTPKGIEQALRVWVTWNNGCDVFWVYVSLSRKIRVVSNHIIIILDQIRSL